MYTCLSTQKYGSSIQFGWSVYITLCTEASTQLGQNRSKKQMEEAHQQGSFYIIRLRWQISIKIMITYS